MRHSAALPTPPHPLREHRKGANGIDGTWKTRLRARLVGRPDKPTTNESANDNGTPLGDVVRFPRAAQPAALAA